MLYLIIFVVILIVVIAVSSFLHHFTLIRIKGDSMSPTLLNGQFKLVDRKIHPKYISLFGNKIPLGTILVYNSPDNYAVVKRLKQKAQVTNTETFYWFEGDNHDNSKDSRHYGFVSEDRIFGEVISFTTFLYRTFTHTDGLPKGDK